MMASTAVIISVERRRRWPPAEKEQLVAASLEPGASVSEVVAPGGTFGRTSCEPVVQMAQESKHKLSPGGMVDSNNSRDKRNITRQSRV
jgi:transposase-like protein